MNKSLIIAILIIGLFISLCFIVFNNPVVISEMEKELIKQKDSIQKEFNIIQARYSLAEKDKDRLAAELLEFEGKITRSEIKLSELLKKERHAQIENKRLIEKYSNYQFDSAFMAMYPMPDSVRR